MGEYTPSFEIKFCNIMGLGHFDKGKYTFHGIPYKIKELVSSSQNANTIYFCFETKLNANRKRKIKFPKGISYIGETSGNSGSAGVLVFADNNLKIENQSDVETIVSKYALFVKLKVGTEYFNLIGAYFPSDQRDCINIIKQIEQFILNKNITNFSFFGDFNLHLNANNAKTKYLLSFLDKYNLFDLRERLNVNIDYTWRGRKKRANSKSIIDFFFTNHKQFTKMKFCHTSFSDHKSVSICTKKQFMYKKPSWKEFLFKLPEFTNLLKQEAAKFLIQKADPLSKIKPADFYLLNTNEIDQHFTFNDFPLAETNIVFDLVNHLKTVHDKFYSKYRSRNFEKTKRFDHQLDMLYSKYDLKNSEENLALINDLITEQQSYFKKLVYTRQETYYIRSLMLDGLPNKLTYKYIKSEKRHEYNILVDGEFINCPERIAELFANKHSKLVAPENLVQCDLENLLAEYELSLNDIFPKIRQVSSPECSTLIFKKVINSMKNSAAPGPSSQIKAIYSLLFNFIPNIATKGFNNVYSLDIDNISSLKFLKERSVIFIPKKDSNLNDLNSFRPISLLEVPYKILSKALNLKVANYLNKIVHPDQFAGVKKRHMASASISICSVINYIKNKDIPAQLISFDIKAAFDRVLYDTVNKIIHHIFPNGTFADSWCNLTSGGKFFVKIDQKCSKVYNIFRSVPQGGPSAQTKFILYMHVFIALLNSPPLQTISFKIKEQILPPIAFADDCIKAVSLKDSHGVSLIKKLLVRMKEAIDLEINFSKTKILTNGNFPESMLDIGTPCESIKHLGIFLSFDTKLAQKLTYDHLLAKMNSRLSRIPFHAKSNIFKRRNLTVSLFNSLAFHVYRIYNPTSDQLKQLWKITSKFLWTSTNIEGKVSSRYKVAQNRVELDVIDGGLSMFKPHLQCFFIWFTSFINTLKHAKEYPLSTLGIIFNYRHLPINSLLNDLSYCNFVKYQYAFKALYPNKNSFYFSTALDFLLKLEKNKETFLHTSITNSLLIKQFKFDKNEIKILNFHNVQTIGSLLEFRYLDDKTKKKIIMLPKIRANLFDTFQSNDISLWNKLVKVVDHIKCNFISLNIISNTQYKKSFKTLVQLSYNNPSVFVLHFKHIFKNENYSEHPSFKTRRRDGIFMVDEDLFKLSFKKILDSPILLYYKAFFFEQFCRTLNSKNKLFKFGLANESNCLKCNVVATSEHCLFECKFPSYASSAIAKFLDMRYNDSAPDFIFLKESFFLCNTYYEQFSTAEYTQLTLLILVIKDKCIKIANDPCIERWSKNNFFSQLILIIQFTIKLLDNINFVSEFLDDFLNYILKYQDNISYFDQ